MDTDLRAKLRQAFTNGDLQIRSVSPSGDVVWKRVLDVLRHPATDVPLWKLDTDYGSMIVTESHKVFTSPVDKKEACQLQIGDTVQSISKEGAAQLIELSGKSQVPSREYMYDLTVDDWHNFVLENSTVVVSNSPDKNYHFRPPTGEGTINCYNQVFGYIWEDAEFDAYLRMALDKWNMQAPATPEICDVDTLCRRYPSWKAALRWGALVTAAQALAYNWASDEFSYSIGGISLDIDKHSKYMDLKRNAEEQWDKLVEAKYKTVHYVRGIQQPKYGMGIRSSFGPYTGRGVLSPRKWV